MLQGEVLIFELVAEDGLAASAIMGGKVAPLAHEVGDDSVESGALVAEPLFASTKGAEVLGGFGHHVGTEL